MSLSVPGLRAAQISNFEKSTARSTIDRLVITGDLLRPDGQQGPHSQTTNIMWLHSLLSPQLCEATGLPAVAVTNQNAEFGFRSFYELAGSSPSEESWAKLYKSAPPDVRLNWARQFDGSIVIGFELPPSLRAALLERGIAFIDCMINPIRFMDDVFFGMRSSSAEINAVFASRTLPRRKVRAAAGAVSALAYRKQWVGREEPFSLFVGQMFIDRSMIVDGILRTPDSLRDPIVTAIGSPSRLKFSDHPLQKSDQAFAVVSAHAKHVQRTARNTYALLANPALEKVVTISSSVGVEAQFFGKSVSYAIGPSSPVLFFGDADDGFSYWSIFNDFMAADFWRLALAPLLPVTAPDGDGPLWRPSLLRSTLGVGWGYDQMFSVPPPAATPSTPLVNPSTLLVKAPPQSAEPIARPSPRRSVPKKKKPRGLRKLRRELIRPLSQGWALGAKLAAGLAPNLDRSNSVRGFTMALELVNSGIRSAKPVVLHPRTSGPRALLVIDAGFPAMKSGSRQVLEAQLCALRSNGYAIDFLMVYPARFPKRKPVDPNLLRQFPVEVAYEAGLDLAPHQVPAASRWIRPSRIPGQRCLGELLAASRSMVTSCEFEAQAKTQPYDIILANYVWNLPLALKVAAGASSVIVETHDIQSRQIAYWRGNEVLNKNLKREISALAKADAVIALNSDEFQFFTSRIEPDKVHLLYPPAITDTEQESGKTLLERAGASPWRDVPRNLEKIDALFLGSRHDPNREGIQWFITSVLPIVRRQMPNFTLAIAGPVIQVIKERGNEGILNAKGVYPLGVVKRVAPLYQAARMVIVPIRHGEGVSIKTIEAFGYGKALVTTSIGLRGLPPEIDHPAFDVAEEFAARVLNLSEDDAEKQAAEAASQRIHKLFFHQETYNHNFKQVVSKLVAKRAQPPTR